MGIKCSSFPFSFSFLFSFGGGEVFWDFLDLVLLGIVGSFDDVEVMNGQVCKRVR